MDVTSNTSDIIVIGGGVAGLSTAMQLAMRGQKVIVLERQRLGCGSTGRAAGLLGQLRGTAEHTRMLADGMEIALPVPASSSPTPGKLGAHSFEVVYVIERAPCGLWARFEAPAPDLPLQPLAFRRVWRLRNPSMRRRERQMAWPESFTARTQRCPDERAA